MKKTTYRIEFTLEKSGRAQRKAVEGTNLALLEAKVDRLGGFNVDVRTETVEVAS